MGREEASLGGAGVRDKRAAGRLGWEAACWPQLGTGRCLGAVGGDRGRMR